jgi:ADP-ribose pyrophosphatase YjhB (NUDIX family)
VADVGELEGWRLCPRCGAELRGDLARLECESCDFVVYAGSRPTVSALCADEGRLLLVRRAVEPFIGLWDLPGGFLEEGEHPLDGLRRELLEETGLYIEPRAYLGAFVEPYLGRYVLGLTWQVDAAGDAIAADAVAEVAWFSPAELPPPDSFAFPHHPRLLRAWGDASGSPRP